MKRFASGVLWLLVAGCARQPEPEPLAPAPSSEVCVLLTDTTGAASSVSVALLDEVSPADAPRPRNDAERLLFRQLYETLVRLDCVGELRPGLAESWSAGADGRSWRFVLRGDARFWDGSPLTVGDVIRSWGVVPDRAPASPSVDSVRVNDSRTFTVYVDGPPADAPLQFADPALAVTRQGSGSMWPLGTGPYAIEGPLPSDDLSHLTINAEPTAGGELRRIRFRLATGDDARDLIDRGIDLLVTGDPDVLDYVALRPEYTALPLAWDRTYVLMSPTRARKLGTGRVAAAGLPYFPDALLGALARDAVRGDARGHNVPAAWWENGASCEGLLADLRELPPAVSTAAYRVRGPHRVVYRRGDRVARDLAERIVALATRPASPEQLMAMADAVPGLNQADAPLIVVEMEADEFETALARGSEFLFVLPLPAKALDRCYQLARLAERVPWLNVGWLEPSFTIVPLVDTRRHAVVRQGAGPLWLDWDGTVLMAYTTEGARRP